MAPTTQIVLLDGGMGRELKQIGAPFRQPEWSALALIEAPDLVEQVHQSFVDAGAKVITSNNYAVVPFHLGAERFAAEGAALCGLAGRLARRVAQSNCDKAICVAGSIPPMYGSYRPDLFEPERASNDYALVFKSLSPMVDYWLSETTGSLSECAAIVEAWRRDGEGKALHISFSLQDQWVDAMPVLRSGESVLAAYLAAKDAGAAAILFNCSQPEYISAAIAIVAEQAPTIGFGGYANAFSPRPLTAEANRELASSRDDLSPAQYRDEFVAKWVEQGASVIGGCCGIGPVHIAAIRQWLDRREAVF